MEQFVNDLRDIILGLLHLIAWLIHAIAWIVHAIGWLIHGITLLVSAVAWLLHQWPWLLAIAAVFLFVVYVLPELPRIMEASGMTALFKRKPPEVEPPEATGHILGERYTDPIRAASQQAATDLVWAVRNGDVERINEALRAMSGDARLTAEITETDTHTITVKKRLVVG